MARGSLRLDAVVPAGMNTEGLAVLAEGVPPVRYGTPLSEAYAQGSFVRRLLELPQVAGALHSLVGPEPWVDHHFVHTREPNGGDAQPLHGDAIIDVRADAFDVQLMYFPQAVTLEMGGTLTVPGSHLRRINESDTGPATRTCAARTDWSARPGRWCFCTTVSGTGAGATTAT